MAKKKDTRGPRERAYDEHMAPLVDKLIALSHEYLHASAAATVLPARAIAKQALLSLLASDAQGFSLSGEGAVWVRERAALSLH